MQNVKEGERGESAEKERERERDRLTLILLSTVMIATCNAIILMSLIHIYVILHKKMFFNLEIHLKSILTSKNSQIS